MIYDESTPFTKEQHDYLVKHFVVLPESKLTDAEKLLEVIKVWLSKRIETCEAMQVGANPREYDTWRNRQDATEEVFYFLEDNPLEELLSMYEDK